MLLRDLGDLGYGGQSHRSSPERRPQRKERHKGDLVLLSEINQRVILAVDDAVAVLDLGNIDELERQSHMTLADVREPDQIDLACNAQVLECTQLLLERYEGAAPVADQVQVDESETLDEQRAEVLLDSLPKLLRSLCRKDPPAASRPAPTFVTSLRFSG